MRRIICGAFLCLLSHLSWAQEFNKKLADSLGADEYGMRSYMFVLLTIGPQQIEDKKLSNQYFKGHMENINKLVEEGKMILAGPFGKNDLQYRGLFLLNTVNQNEAEQWMQLDPAISNGLLKATYVPWYGSAAIPLYIPHHQQIQKLKI